MNRENTINYIEIPATDMAGTEFFSELFGWEVQDYGPDYCSFNDGKLDGGFFKSDKVVSTEAGSVLIVSYRDDLEKAVSEVEAACGEIVKPIFSFPGGRRFHFTDPSGNQFAIWSEK
ncbi:MAG: VOC family protein [Bacteroidetes bacterium]|nr:VOC family protein [Bacteroidota bacterium]